MRPFAIAPRRRHYGVGQLQRSASLNTFYTLVLSGAALALIYVFYNRFVR